MKTFIIENTWLPRNSSHFDFGWGNGYVLIPVGHPIHGRHFENINVRVYRDLTFSELVDSDMIERWGLDKEDEGTWCIGFDTAHLGTSLKEWTKEKVQEETYKLRNQLIALGTLENVFEITTKVLEELSKFKVPKTLLINNNNTNNNFINNNEN
jgi:hypothetical protein